MDKAIAELKAIADLAARIEEGADDRHRKTKEDQRALRLAVEARMGEVQQLTPTIDALYVPNIDDSLDDQEAKGEFWAAFRELGSWYSAQPPY